MEKIKYDTKYLKNENLFFILYDWYDNFICYYDNVYELIADFHYKTIAQLAFLFNRSSNEYIQVQRFKDKLLKLYCFNFNDL